MTLGASQVFVELSGAGAARVVAALQVSVAQVVAALQVSVAQVVAALHFG